jgi:hypothetical protein
MGKEYERTIGKEINIRKGKWRGREKNFGV